MFPSTYDNCFLNFIVLLLGWQPRWFVLEVGVLAYYKSQEEVGLGSRGSVKMACCEISGKLAVPVTNKVNTKDSNTINNTHTNGQLIANQ